MRDHPPDWHARFVQQARWTHSLRQYLYQRAGLKGASCILDVGCGTGALLGELQTYSPQVHGIDIDFKHLDLAKHNAVNTLLACADGQCLPYPVDTFDLALCHFLLLWVPDPTAIIIEMARVTRPGHLVLALAEPDYGGRIDYPMELSALGRLQSQALQLQGADVHIGRKLAQIFHRAGLKNIETGVLGGQWPAATMSDDQWKLEWEVLESDLSQLTTSHPSAGLSRLLAVEEEARQKGERVLFVPTFWALGTC